MADKPSHPMGNCPRCFTGGIAGTHCMRCGTASLEPSKLQIFKLQDGMYLDPRQIALLAGRETVLEVPTVGSLEVTEIIMPMEGMMRNFHQRAGGDCGTATLQWSSSPCMAVVADEQQTAKIDASTSERVIGNCTLCFSTGIWGQECLNCHACNYQLVSTPRDRNDIGIFVNPFVLCRIMRGRRGETDAELEQFELESISINRVIFDSRYELNCGDNVIANKERAWRELMETSLPNATLIDIKTKVTRLAGTKVTRLAGTRIK